MIKNIGKILSLGLDDGISGGKLKKIKILNVFCLIGLVLGTLVFIGDYYIDKKDPYITIFICGALIFGSLIVIYLQLKRQFLLAKLFFIGQEMGVIFLITKFIYPGEFLEYYFIFPPSLALILIDSKFYNYLILILSYLSMIFPTAKGEMYNLEVFNNFHLTFLFFSVFIMVNYFKNLNIKNEKSLELKKKELERVNLYQSQFFINISHEIRTPLTLINGQIEQLKELEKSNPEIEHIQKILSTHTSDINSMVNDVLDLAKMKSADFKLVRTTINLSDLLKDIYISFQTNFNLRGIDFQLLHPKDKFEIHADYDYLKRSINNLVVNALKYTKKQGKVRLELSKKETQLRLAIIDNGIGISEYDIDKVCDAFYQVDNDINRSGGSGIGLGFTKEIIERHGGELQIRSQLNKGSTFTIIFPFEIFQVKKKEGYKEPNHKISVRRQPVKPKNKNQIKSILIVDDNIEMQFFLKNIMHDYSCIGAENGLDGLSILEKNKVDLIITDYMMPGMNGPDFIRSLEEKKYDIPIIMVTARSDKESMIDCLRLGIDDYLNKPFDSEELRIRAQNLIKNHCNRVNFIQNNKISNREIEDNNMWIIQVEKYIEDACSDPNLKQIDIAEKFNLSESSLYRKIKSTRGKTPNEFITEVKLQKARKLIESDPSISLKKLSLEVGFRHNYYFSKIYYQRFGIKPNRF